MAICAENIPDRNYLVGKIFTNGNSHDFSLVSEIADRVGAPLSVFENLQNKAEAYGIAIEPTNWQMDYEAQTKAIVESAPPGSTYDWSEWPEKVMVNLPSGQEFGGHSEFELRIKTPDDRA